VRFELPERLLAMLRDRRDRERLERGNVEQGGMLAWQVEVEDAHDAFLLDPGMGPMLFITAQGRILVDGRSWEGEPLREATAEEAIVAILAGASNTGIAELMTLLPPKPPGGQECPTCAGRRRAPAPGTSGTSFVCWDCNGLGWKR
jgi:hypothetical protein